MCMGYDDLTAILSGGPLAWRDYFTVDRHAGHGDYETGPEGHGMKTSWERVLVSLTFDRQNVCLSRLLPLCLDRLKMEQANLKQ